MNRLVLIGNGFDLAHGLKTSYADFINWYWDRRVAGFIHVNGYVSTDLLCTFKEISDDRMYWSTRYLCDFKQKLHPLEGKAATSKEIIDDIIKTQDVYEVTFSPLFERIIKNFNAKGWVNIENDYYELLKEFALEEDSEEKTKELNTHLHFLQEKLIEYLSSLTIADDIANEKIREIIYSPLQENDISIDQYNSIREHVENRTRIPEAIQKEKNRFYPGMKMPTIEDNMSKLVINKKVDPLESNKNNPDAFLPNRIMLLNFNYTKTAELYAKKNLVPINQIHGRLDEPASVIFGYGDEMDEKYKELLNKNDNDCLTNIKSIKYLEADNYRKMLSFIEAEPFQVFIMGHSCGNSDRTLLNTLFEHPNCVSIKPYYYVKDDGSDTYLDIVQNISRNFTDMKKMRDRVVNKTYCEPLPQAAEDNE